MADTSPDLFSALLVVCRLTLIASSGRDRASAFLPRCGKAPIRSVGCVPFAKSNANGYLLSMRRGRKTKREEIQALNAVDRFYASTSNREPQFQRELPKQRAPRKPSGKPLERDILRDIMDALRKHPAVATVQRRQSGVYQDGGRWIRVGVRGEADISGILKGGRAYAIEVKRPGRLPDERQTEFLNRIQAAGGVAGVASSVAEALQIIARR